MEFTKAPSNHPAHSPLTEERLIRVREELQRTLEYSEGSNLNYVIADAVKAINEVLERRKAEQEAMPMFYVECDAAKRLIKGQTRFATITNEPKKGVTLPLYIQPQPAPISLTTHHGTECDLLRPRNVNGTFIPRDCDCGAGQLSTPIQGAE